MREFEDHPVPEHMMGEVWPAAQPGEDPVLYGHAEISPCDPVAVRSAQTFELVYNVGRYGLDDTGSIRVSFRAMGDGGTLQTTDPRADNYVSATTSSGVPLVLKYDGRGAGRPRFKALTVFVRGGYLREGDTITIVFGDRSGGSAGLKMQTMVEADFQFRVSADVCAVGHYVPIPNSPAISIVPGPPERWRLVLPSLRRPGESFRLGVKAEDLWGNPSDQVAGRFRLRANLDVDGLPAEVTFTPGRKSVVVDGLNVESPGTLVIDLVDDAGITIASSSPLLIRAGAFSGYWGDMHGQSGESIGITTADQYFDFARNKAFLDAVGHQANDFQVNNAFWAHVNKLCAEHHEDGVFVTLPGYEWSGNTAVGGDRNVYYRTEGRPIYRSSHALLTDRSDLSLDAPNANRLFERLADEDCVVYAHVGGRYADIAYAHDPKTEVAMEIHSAWGTFEWLLTDGFPLGHRSGVVCNSDGHKGRPGASYPGASTFGAYGGLTCFLTDELTRDGLFRALKSRHTYGTTGTRLHLNVEGVFAGGARFFERDPNVYPATESRAVQRIMMGDIAATDDRSVSMKIEVVAGAPLERIEVRNGSEVVATLRDYDVGDLGERFRVLWQGAEYRGRGRNTTWRGEARFSGAAIRHFETINAWNHERLLRQDGSDGVVFDAITTGNYGGFDVWLDGSTGGDLAIETNHGNLNVSLDDIGFDDVIHDAGGLERKIRVFRMPEKLIHRPFEVELDVPLAPTGDNPLWVSVYTEDGFQAWSSPMFVFRDEA